MVEQNTTDRDSAARPTLSIAIITLNEEANIRRTLESVKWADEIVIVDSGSTDRTCEIAREYGAKVFVEPWKGFAAQKNSALDKCTSDWILSLDADEEVSEELQDELSGFREWRSRSLPPELLSIVENSDKGDLQAKLEKFFSQPGQQQRLREHHAEFEQKYKHLFRNKHMLHAMWQLMKESRRTADGFGVGIEIGGGTIPRKNFYLGKWIRHGGFYPDRKLRLLQKGQATFQSQLVHETAITQGPLMSFRYPLIHHAYPTLTSYIEHMNRYSSLGAEMVVEKKGNVGFSLINILLRPWGTFVYNYFFRLGFLDGKEGLLLHLYHAVYVSWKYAKAWELSGKADSPRRHGGAENSKP